MTTGERETGNSPEDEILSRVYQQVTELQAARLGTGYDIAAGSDRFLAWLREHTAEDKVRLAAVRAGRSGALQAGPAANSATGQPPAGPGETALVTGASRGPDGIQSDAPGAWTGLAADRAVTALYEMHYSALVRLAALLVRDMATAQEIVQDSFVALHHARRGADSDLALSYLRQSVVNRSRSALRHRIIASSDAAEPATGSRGAEQPIAAPYPAVISALRTLPARQREVLVLRYYADLSEAQAADVMGISQGAVRRHATRATSALRAILDSAD
jgi:RNA polymerase sigma factor (sigma-70 family)